MESQLPSSPVQQDTSAVDVSYLTQLQESATRLTALENEIHQLHEHVPFGYHVLQADGTYQSINTQELSWLGYTRDEVIGKIKFAEKLSPASQEKYARHLPDAFRCGFIEALELELLDEHGAIRHTLLSAIISRNESGNIQDIRSVLFDISDRKKAEHDQRIAAIAFESQEGMVITDAQGSILRTNKAYSTICGYTSEELRDKNPRILNSGRHDKRFYEAMWKNLLEEGYWEGEIWNRRKNGEIFLEHLVISAVKDGAGNISNYIGTMTDITLSRQADLEIQRLAFYDALTHLPNRRLLMDRLKLSLASSARTGNRGALMFLDLDNFKMLNDTLGHDIGDLLLQQTAQRLESSVRAGDTVARLGGDEFVVMLEDLSIEAVEAASQTKNVGKQILAALNQPFQLASHEYRCTASIGATLFQNHLTEIDDLFRQADIAMYQAKKDGRNTMRFFDHEMQKIINLRATIESALSAAIEHRQFQLHYQVQVDSQRRPIGAEALIRWHHPEMGLVLPAQFIPLAEETGLIIPIGEWVLETACAQLKAWQQDPLTQPLSLSVNVSAKQFQATNFVEQVHAAILHHDIPPSSLKLEPTESILLEKMEDAVSTMNALKEFGIHFALDDFGTGFSSLQYLKKLPLNQLKIDQSFVKELVSDTSDLAIVKTIIAMAHSLDLEVIAEGVETEAQLNILKHHGCNHFQGYLFSKPVPADEFEALLRKS